MRSAPLPASRAAGGPTLSTPAAARAFVQQVCHSWELDSSDANLIDRAVLLANELVTNAVIHANTDLVLRLELRDDRLNIAVHDDSPRLLRAVASDPHAPGAVGCGWSSSSPRPGASAATPTAARSSGAPCSCSSLAIQCALLRVRPEYFKSGFPVYESARPCLLTHHPGHGLPEHGPPRRATGRAPPAARPLRIIRRPCGQG